MSSLPSPVSAEEDLLALKRYRTYLVQEEREVRQQEIVRRELSLGSLARILNSGRRGFRTPHDRSKFESLCVSYR
jgi:hypothetical protein